MNKNVEIAKVVGLIDDMRWRLLGIRTNLSSRNIRDASIRIEQEINPTLEEIGKICAKVRNYEEEEEAKNGGDEWI